MGLEGEIMSCPELKALISSFDENNPAMPSPVAGFGKGFVGTGEPTNPTPCADGHAPVIPAGPPPAAWTTLSR